MICCLLPMIAVTGQEQQAQKMLGEAVYEEEVNGDLNKAIDTYQLIISQYPDNRKISAEAYYHMGICYEKLGNQEAMKAYEEVIRNYGEQKEVVAMARDRLARLMPIVEQNIEPAMSPTYTRVQIPSLLSWNAVTSPDGQELLVVYDEQLWKIPLSGNLGPDIPGRPEQLNTDDVRVIWAGLSWSADGKTIAFNEDNPAYLKDIPEEEKKNQNIYVLSAKGGKPQKIVENYCDLRAVNYRISLSPDGSALAYTSVDEDKLYINLIPVEGGIPRKLVDSPAREPAFSPDGKMIAFVDDEELGRQGGGLWAVPLSGGKPTLVADAENASSPVWSPDASKIAFLDDAAPNKIVVVPVNKEGQTVKEKTTINAPDGTTGVSFLTGWSANNKLGMIISRAQYGLYTMPSDGGQAAKIFNGAASQPRWSPDGKRIFFRKDAEQGGEGWQNDRLSVIPADGGEGKDILTVHGDHFGFLQYGMGNRISPDGERIVVSGKKIEEDTVYINHYPTTQIWTTSTNGGALIKITNPPVPYSDDNPCWSPDGKSIAFIRTQFIEDRMNRYGVMGIYVVSSTGGEPELLLSEPEAFIFSIDWSPDGEWIAYLKGDKQSNDPGNSTLNVVNVNNGISKAVGEVSNFTVHTELAWSHDARRIAFNDEEGKAIKVMSVDDGSVSDVETGLVDTSIFHLDWSPDGKRFVFVGYQGGVPEFWLIEDFLPSVEAQ